MATIKFGTDGWRGVIAQDFTFENVRIVAHAIARYVARAEKPGAGFVVGFDSRYASDRFARAAAEAVAATGIEVALADHFAPTPAVSLLVKMRGASGGIQISASHNPYQWNGIKYKASYGSSAGPAIVAEIEKELAAVLRDGVPSLPARPEPDQAARHSQAVPREARHAGGLGKAARREFPLHRGPDARRGQRPALEAF